MSTIESTRPEYLDEVRHKNGSMTGVVIAKYQYEGKRYLDVCGINEKIYYGTPEDNWVVVRRADDNG